MNNKKNNVQRPQIVEFRIIRKEVNFDIVGKFINGKLVSERRVRQFGF
jgi:hypothetical protein